MTGGRGFQAGERRASPRLPTDVEEGTEEGDADWGRVRPRGGGFRRGRGEGYAGGGRQGRLLREREGDSGGREGESDGGGSHLWLVRGEGRS